MKDKFVTKIGFEIFEVSADGLLKKPTENDYGNVYNVFNEIYDTEEEAILAIEEKYQEDYVELVIIRSVSRTVEYYN
jgi:hypothetical protein